MQVLCYAPVCVLLLRDGHEFVCTCLDEGVPFGIKDLFSHYALAEVFSATI